MLEGYDDRVIGQVSSRRSCQELCLQETEFQCMSAEYVYSSQECRLSRETRRSQPSSYRATTSDVDYLENQCAKERRGGSCAYDPYPDQDIGYADIQVTARDSQEVGRHMSKAETLLSYSSAGRCVTRPLHSTAGATPSSAVPGPAGCPEMTTSLQDLQLLSPGRGRTTIRGHLA